MKSVAPSTGAILKSAGPVTTAWLLTSGKFCELAPVLKSSRGKNIRGPAAIATQVHTDDGVVCASVLSKSWDLKEAIFRDWDCQRRSCDDLALESCLVWLFPITDKKCGTRYRRDLHCSRTCD